MKFFKKLLIMLMLMGFASTSVYADDDDYYDEDDEEVAKPKPKAAAKRASEPSEASDDGSTKLGFYGSIAGASFDFLQEMGSELDVEPIIGTTSRIGLLLNLGSDLELGLGIGFLRFSSTVTQSSPNGSTEGTVAATMYEIVPSISYQLGKAGFVGYGLGVDVYLASWSVNISSGGESVTEEPDGMDLAFYPNFILRAEIVKNFQIWLKAGLFIYMLPENKDEDYGYTTTISSSVMSTKTEIGFSFFL